MTLHDLAVQWAFGDGTTDKEVGSLLVKVGWIYTIVVAVCQIWITAPYGKLMEQPGMSRLTGLKISAKVGWVVQECPSFFVAAALLWDKWSSGVNATQLALLSLFLGHYFNRTFVFPFQILGSKQTSLFVVANAFLFTAYNGFIQAHYVLYVVDFDKAEVFSPTFILGVIIFFVGMYINIDSDKRLRLLRSQAMSSGDNAGAAERYKIPHGGMFDYVSSANYFGEIVEWWGFALAARFTPAALLFAGFTTTFLGMRGVHNHRWYQEKFGQRYPAMRRAVIPMIL